MISSIRKAQRTALYGGPRSGREGWIGPAFPRNSPQDGWKEHQSPEPLLEVFSKGGRFPAGIALKVRHPRPVAKLLGSSPEVGAKITDMSHKEPLGREPLPQDIIAPLLPRALPSPKQARLPYPARHPRQEDMNGMYR